MFKGIFFHIEDSNGKEDSSLEKKNRWLTCKGYCTWVICQETNKMNGFVIWMVQVAAFLNQPIVWCRNLCHLNQ